MQSQQDLCLLRVIFIKVDSADGVSAIDHRHSCLTAESVVSEGGVIHVLSIQRLGQLLEQGVPVGTGALLGVIEQLCIGVGDHNAGQVAVAHQRHHLLHPRFSQLSQLRQVGGNHLGFRQDALLGLEHQRLAGQQGIGVEEDKDGGDDEQIGQGKLGLDVLSGAELNALPLPPLHRAASSFFK